MKKIVSGKAVTITVETRDPDTKTLTNPGGSVIFVVEDPAGSETTYTYGTSVEVVRLSTGRHRLTFTPTAAGEWEWKFAATVPNTVLEGAFLVVPSRLA